MSTRGSTKNPGTDRAQIASRLREARKSAGLTQAQAASLLGLHRPTISEIEAGRRRVSAEEIKSFGSLYEVGDAWLLGTDSVEGADPAVELAARELSKLSRDDFERVVRLLNALKRSEEPRS